MAHLGHFIPNSEGALDRSAGAIDQPTRKL